MAALEFKFDDILREITAFRAIAKPFLSHAADPVLDRLRSSLQETRSLPPGRTAEWTIDERSPLQTRETRGYEPGGKGGQCVFGEMTSTWTITPAPSDKPQPKRQPPKCFRMIGLASVRLRILRRREAAGEQSELAMWRMELGAPDAPGCYFHVQILGQHAEPPFPKSLSVPRLPALAFTPMAALEFLIGELFQDEWKQHSAQETGAMQSWKSVQRPRLTRLLDWKRQQIQSCSGSPWTALKVAQPHSALFVEN